MNTLQYIESSVFQWENENIVLLHFMWLLMLVFTANGMTCVDIYSEIFALKWHFWSMPYLVTPKIWLKWRSFKPFICFLFVSLSFVTIRWTLYSRWLIKMLLLLLMLKRKCDIIMKFQKKSNVVNIVLQFFEETKASLYWYQRRPKQKNNINWMLELCISYKIASCYYFLFCFLLTLMWILRTSLYNFEWSFLRLI